MREIQSVDTQPAGATSNACPNSPSEAEGTLQGRKVKIHYPGFGENTARNNNPLIDVLIKVAIVAAVVIVAAVIGFLIASVIGAVIGACIAGGIFTALAITKMIIDKSNKYHLLTELPQEGGHKELLPPDAAKVGKYYDANVRLTKTADESLMWKKEFIACAQDSIELSVNFAGGTDFRDCLALIDSRMSQNPQFTTHIIASVDLLEQADKEAIKTLQEKFADRFQILLTDRYLDIGLDLHTEENHVKMLIVDGKYFVGGGTSIHPRLTREEYDPENDTEKPADTAHLLEPCTRDTDLVGESEQIAQTMRDQFYNLYRIWEIRTLDHDQVKSRYFPLTGTKGHSDKFATFDDDLTTARVKLVVSGPEHRGNNPIIRQYVKRIQKAEKDIRFGNLQFYPPEEIKNALSDAKAKNPDLKRVAHVNGEGPHFSIAKLPQTLIARGNYSLMDKVYEYQTANRVYHKKVATFDSTHMIVGSFNLGSKSARYDHEMVFVVKNKKVTDACKESLKEDSKQSKKIGAAACASISIIDQLLSSIFALFIQNFV